MEFITDIWPYFAALIPTVGVAFLFYWVVRYMIEADRSERKALAQWNAEHRDSADLRGNMGGDSGGADDNGSDTAAGNDTGNAAGNVADGGLRTNHDNGERPAGA